MLPFVRLVLLPPFVHGWLAAQVYAARDVDPVQAVGYAVAFATGLLGHAAYYALEAYRIRVGQEAPSDAREMLRREWHQEKAQAEYSLTIADDSPWYRMEGGQLQISKHPRGHYPWLVLPEGIGRAQVEAFFDCSRNGREFTERNLAGGGKAFSQVSLRRWRDWLLFQNWAISTRPGRHASIALTPRGARVVRFIYWRLQGQPEQGGAWLDPLTHFGRMSEKGGMQSSDGASSE
jgi:hypothetical protein